MIDEACGIASHRGIHHKVVVDPEHVAADALALVQLLSLIGERGPDQFTRILDHHFACLNVPRAVQAASMDVRAEHSHTLLGRLLQRTIAHRHWQVAAAATSKKKIIKCKLISNIQS